MSLIPKKIVKRFLSFCVLVVALVGFFYPLASFCLLFILAAEMLGFHFLPQKFYARSDQSNDEWSLREEENEIEKKPRARMSSGVK